MSTKKKTPKTQPGSTSDFLADTAGVVSRGIKGTAGTIVICVGIENGGLSIAVGSDIRDVKDIRNALVATLRRL